MNAVVSIILAAGYGKRMESPLPKVLHPLAGQPMVSYSLELVKTPEIQKRIIILGHQIEIIREFVNSIDKEIICVHQKQQLGTGHALQEAEPYLTDFNGTILILSADVPLLKQSTIHEMIAYQKNNSASCTLLTTKLENPKGYGRIIRDKSGKILEIVEQSDLKEGQDRVNEINSGIYCFNSKDLFAALSLIKKDNFQKEYYLTDVIKIMRDKGSFVGSVSVQDPVEVLGVNTQQELAYVSQIMYQKNATEHMEKGVTIISPVNTFLERNVIIGKGTIIYPFTLITNGCQIGNNSHIGPFSNIIRSQIGDESRVLSSMVEQSKIGNKTTVGPYAHVRPESIIGDDVRIGNYVEIKKTFIDHGAKASHMSYLGDATLGKNVNIGAGTIICNYDGIRKNPTIIEDGVFIGSNNSLVAPLTIGKSSYTAAGSTITENIPPLSLGIARSRQKNILGWAEKKNMEKHDNKKEN